MWKKQKKNSLVLAIVMSLLVGIFSIPGKASAEKLGNTWWAVYGNYTITSTKLTTKSRLEYYIAEEHSKDKKKKVRTFKVSPETMISIWSDSKENYIPFTGNKRKQVIKKMNKKKVAIAFWQKDGVVQHITLLDPL